MQLARLMYRLNTRTPAGKLRQIALALWLEARYSKRDLLEAYLNVVPFGGNIQGVGAASRIYFGKSPDRVTPRRGADARRDSAAAGPRAPAGRRRRPSLLAARARLGALWLAHHGGHDDADRRQVELPIVARPRVRDAVAGAALRRRAARRPRAPRAGRIDTTLDAGLQRLVERQIQRLPDSSAATSAFATRRRCSSTRATCR